VAVTVAAPRARAAAPAAPAAPERRPQEPAGREAVAVAVVEAPAARDLEPRVVAEIRAALRGCTQEGLAAHLGAAPALVEGALQALAAKGTVARRGTRWFMS
jgi:hypothetical protein